MSENFQKIFPKVTKICTVSYVLLQNFADDKWGLFIIFLQFYSNSDKVIKHFFHVKNVSEPNTDTGTQNEMRVFCMGSSFAPTRTNGNSSPVDRREPDKTKIWIIGIAREWSLSMNRGFSTTIPNSNVKVRRSCEKGSKNIRKFYSRNWWGRSSWWCFPTDDLSTRLSLAVEN